MIHIDCSAAKGRVVVGLDVHPLHHAAGGMAYEGEATGCPASKTWVAQTCMEPLPKIIGQMKDDLVMI